jgi:excisionase family DNA binding protein
MAQPEVPSFLSEKQTATYLSISLSTIRRWRKARKGPQFYRVGNVIRYRRDDVDHFIQQNMPSAA